jgi:DNA helicase-2/ATP-dependent DNA helicase PcrA
MDEGSLPHSRSVSKPEDVEEERRLAYVGFTRAMQRLYLVRARRRSLFGETQYTEPSRFLDDIPRILIAPKGGNLPTSNKQTSSHSTSSRTNSTTTSRQKNWDDDFNQDPYGETEGRIYGRGETSSSSAQNNRRSLPSAGKFKNQPPQPPIRSKVQRFKPGDRVHHNVFGDGIILKSEMESETEFVEVQFPGKTGKKRLSLDFAHLEKL